MVQERPEIQALFSKIFVWGSLFGVVYLLRSFAVLMFLTFVFAYIQANAVNKLERWIANRPARVVLVGLSLLTVLVLVFAALIPPVRSQMTSFISNFNGYARAVDRELIDFARKYPAAAELLPFDAEQLESSADWELKNSALGAVLQTAFGSGDEFDKESVASLLETASHAGVKLFKVSSQFLLSLLFSFLIVLDLRNLTEGLKSLQETRLHFVYNEIAESVVQFGGTMGKAFEAQFVVAIFNTLLTVAGIWLLGIRGELAFLALVVFLCSFIPIAGVFISSVPICLLALADGGLPRVFMAIVLISIIHAIEAYLLNPRIFGHHLHLNPVVVMILLTICGKLFGVWGLLLSLPVATYLFQHAIQRKPKVDCSDEDNKVS